MSVCNHLKQCKGVRLFTARTLKEDKPEDTKTPSREDATKKQKDTENALYVAYNNFCSAIRLYSIGIPKDTSIPSYTRDRVQGVVRVPDYR